MPIASAVRCSSFVAHVLVAAFDGFTGVLSGCAGAVCHDDGVGDWIGTSSTNSTGLNNAVRPANKLVNINSGTGGAVNEISGLILPTTGINSGGRSGPG